MKRLFRSIPLLAAVLAGCGEAETTLAPIEITDEPISVRTYEDGSRLFVESRQGKNVARIGADRLWGGSIFEVELNGVNMVNIHDLGRQIQISLYDGDDSYDNCAGCRVWGWNPVQSGDRDGNGGMVSAGSLEEDGIFIRARPHHWHAGSMGAVTGRPAPSDIIVEQRISALPGHPFAFRIAYKVIHEANDSHAASYLQEFPAIYANREFPRFVHYAGDRPWSGEPAVESPLPVLNTDAVKRVRTSEWWASFVNRSNVGMTIFAPGAFPYMIPGFLPGNTVGPAGTSTGYVYTFNPFGLEPRQVVVGDVYLILGDYRKARETIYKLHSQIEVRDIASPVGMVEVAPTVQNGTLRIGGWAYDNVAVSSVEIAVDGRPVGQARTGQLRSGGMAAWPGAPANTGYSFLLDSRTLSAGDHEIRATARDPSGNVARWTAQVRVP